MSRHERAPAVGATGALKMVSYDGFEDRAPAGDLQSRRARFLARRGIVEPLESIVAGLAFDGGAR
jgi:hypothetical protein